MSKAKKVKRMNVTMSHKLAALFLIVLLAFVSLAGTITYINAKSGDKYKKTVMSQAQARYDSRVMPARRGDIYDRSGNVLATSNKVYNVILDCLVVNSNAAYLEPTVKALVEVLGLDEGEMRTKLTSEATRESQYQIVKRNISMEEKKTWDAYLDVAYKAAKAKEAEEEGEGEDEEAEEKPQKYTSTDLSSEEINGRLNVQGVWFEEDYLRLYPYNELACDCIGFTYERDTAYTGLEGYYNTLLSGVDGRTYGYFNANSDVEQTIITPTNGSSIETSLDVGAQQIVQKYVTAFNQATGGAHVGVIVMDPNTGEILAMDGGDRYDLNHPRDLSLMYSPEQIKAMTDEQTVSALNAIWSNYTVNDAFEPGSVVKPIVMAAALEKGKILSSDTYGCDGYQIFGAAGDVMIRCAVYPDAHGTQDLGAVIANSCNDAMMQIADKMGVEQFVKTQTMFNFGSRTGIDLPGEGYGMIHTTASMGETELACSSFGQGFTCTMIQEAAALASVINGGYYYQPRLVTGIRDASGTLVKTYAPTLLKQTVSSTISKNIREYMERCITEGTGTHARLVGYSLGGKTGTAEKIPRGNGKYLVSFVGFAPVSDPEVLIYCVVDEPNVEDQSTSIFPQYISQGILTELLPYLGIAPDEPYNGVVEDTLLWEGFEGRIAGEVNGRIDQSGYYVDEDGNRIDWDGRRIDKNGYLLDDEGNYLTDDDGDFIRSTNMEGIDGSAFREGVSNLNSPQPPVDNTQRSNTSNNMETEGITNEEAGLE